MIEGVVVALLIFAAGWVVSKWTHVLITKLLHRRKIDESLVRFLASLAQYGVLAACVIAALGTVGIQTASLVALLGAAGLAIGLALQGNLSHFASGVMLLSFRPFTIGDTIEAGGQTGSVAEIGLFATTLITPENHRITVPNGSITGSAITNFTILGQRRATIEVGVAYGSDIDQVTELLTHAVGQLEAILEDPAPAVVFVGLGASSLDFAVRVWAKNDEFFPMQHQARKAVYNALNQANIEIPFNQIVVHQSADPDMAA